MSSQLPRTGKSRPLPFLEDIILHQILIYIVTDQLRQGRRRLRHRERWSCVSLHHLTHCYDF
jgi:hypothetical protein